MAYSYVVYTGNGSQTDFALPFPYVDRAHISATIEGISVAPFTWVNDQTIRLLPAPAPGYTIRITRNSNRQARLSDYQDGQNITEAALDFDARQIFYVAQEAFDAVADAAAGGDMRRMYNLADVYDPAAARANINAVARSGDQMTGPLYLAGYPTQALQAATKGYVDSLLLNIGVTSFNTRTGAVTLTAGDIASALGYVPVNKTGDTMTGLLTLSADPTAPLHAATKQYVDTRVGAVSTGEWVFPFPPSVSLPAAKLNKTQTANTSDRAGAANLLVERTNGSVPMVSFMNTYKVTSPTAIGAVGDIAMGSLMIFQRATAIGMWAASVGPRTDPGQGWGIIGLKANAMERVGDQGLRRDRTGGSYSMGIQVSPEHTLDVGDGTPVGFDGTFGIGFIRSAAQPNGCGWHNPLYFESNCTSPNGIQMLNIGGSNAGYAPLAIMEARDNFQYGLDFRNATFNDADHTAMWLAQGQAIHFSPLSRIYADPTGNLTFYDQYAGTVHLADLIGGGAGSILATNNTFTGRNTFYKVDGTSAPSVQIESRGNGALTNSGVILDTGYITALDVRKSSNAAVEAATSGGSAAGYFQHKVSGNAAFGLLATALRAQLETTQTASGLNQAAAGHFGLNNAGSGVDGYGVHAEAYHNSTLGGATTGFLVDLYKQQSTGSAIGFQVRTSDSASFDTDIGFLASCVSGGSRKIVRAFAAGSTITGSLNCDYGLDLTNATCNTAAIAISPNQRFSWGGNITQRYDFSAGLMSFGNGVTDHVMFNVAGGFRGVMYQWDGVNGSVGTWYVDSAGTKDAIMNVRSGTRTLQPSNPNRIANWIRIRVDNIMYVIPLYQ